MPETNNKEVGTNIAFDAIQHRTGFTGKDIGMVPGRSKETGNHQL